MSTPQTIEPLTPRFRITPGALLTALGVLVAIAVTVTFITLTGTNHHTTIASPATSQAAATATPHTQYLGPRQQHAPTVSQGAGSAPAGEPAAHYACLGAPHRCLR